MSSRQHLNPLFFSWDSGPEQPQTPMESQSNKKQQESESPCNNQDNPTFTFLFSCEFYAPDKEQKSGFLQVRCSNCPVEWNSTCFNLELLKEKCIEVAVCDKTKESITDLLKESLLDKKNLGVWAAYISSNKSFPKVLKNRKALNPEKFKDWVEEAEAEYPKESGFSCIAPSPDKIKADADQAAQTKVIAAEAKRKQKLRASATAKATQTPTNIPDDLEPDEAEDARSDISSESEKTEQKKFIKLLYDTYPTIGAYNNQYPAVIDPEDSTKYFALTFGKAKEWAQLRHKDEVAFNSPPAHFKYDLTKRNNEDPPAATQNPIPTSTTTSLSPALFSEMVVGVVTAIEARQTPQRPAVEARESPQRPSPGFQNRTPTHSSRKRPVSPEPRSSSPIWAEHTSDSNGIDGFLDFGAYPEEKNNKIRKILEEADVTDYRMINLISEEELMKEGLSRMGVLKLFQATKKYKSRLARDASKPGNNPSTS